MANKFASVVFPRYAEDVSTKKRTLYHSVDTPWDVGQHLILTPHHNFPRGTPAKVTNVTQVKLKDLSEEDLLKLGGITAEEYLARWDAAFPEHSSNTDPLVWRIEFKYNYYESFLIPGPKP
jgi:hypothetical protein